MIIALALVSVLLKDGSMLVFPVFPPGGDYHPQFGFACESDTPQLDRNVRAMIADKRIDPPPNMQKVLAVKILCTATTKV